MQMTCRELPLIRLRSRKVYIHSEQLMRTLYMQLCRCGLWIVANLGPSSTASVSHRARRWHHAFRRPSQLTARWGGQAWQQRHSSYYSCSKCDMLPRSAVMRPFRLEERDFLTAIAGHGRRPRIISRVAPCCIYVRVPNPIAAADPVRAAWYCSIFCDGMG